MAKPPILPQTNAPPESPEGRLLFRLERELQSLKSANKGVYENRLAAHNSAIAAPTGNTWAKGDIVLNSNPAEAGAGGSKYVTWAFICVSGGTPGTWLEMRTLTGN